MSKRKAQVLEACTASGLVRHSTHPLIKHKVTTLDELASWQSASLVRVLGEELVSISEEAAAMLSANRSIMGETRATLDDVRDDRVSVQGKVQRLSHSGIRSRSFEGVQHEDDRERTVHLVGTRATVRLDPIAARDPDAGREVGPAIQYSRDPCLGISLGVRSALQPLPPPVTWPPTHMPACAAQWCTRTRWWRTRCSGRPHRRCSPR